MPIRLIGDWPIRSERGGVQRERPASGAPHRSSAGTIVSYDLDYRGQLWKSQGGKEGARKIDREIAHYVDVMLGNEEDFTACLGFEVEGLDEDISKIDPALPLSASSRFMERL